MVVPVPWNWLIFIRLLKDRYCILSQICGYSFLLDSTWRFQAAVSQHLKIGCMTYLCISFAVLSTGRLVGWLRCRFSRKTRGPTPHQLCQWGQAKAMSRDPPLPRWDDERFSGWRLKPGVFVAVALASAAREPATVVGFLLSSLLPSQKIELRIVGVLKSHLLESVWSHEAIEQCFMFVFVLQSQCFGRFSCQRVLSVHVHVLDILDIYVDLKMKGAHTLYLQYIYLLANNFIILTTNFFQEGFSAQ